MTAADFDRLEEPDELDYELDEGELVVHSAFGSCTRTHEVEVWRDGTRPEAILQDADVLEARDLLPGFALRVAGLFG